MRKFFIILTLSAFAILTFRTSALSGEKTDIKASGYIRNFFIYTDYSNDTAFDALSRLRLRLKTAPEESCSWEIAYEMLPRLRKQNIPALASIPGPALLSYRAYDFDERVYPADKSSDSDFVMTQNLDRLSLTLNRPSYDLHIGRQAVAFGSAHVINPTDIIAPFTYSTLAKEELTGVDAIRLKKPLSDLGEFDTGLVFGENFEQSESAGFIRLKSYIHKTDVALMTMVFRKNLMLGLDLARAIGGAGTWLEAAEVISEETSEENYFRLSIGSDYSLSSQLYAYIEYHYNEAGAENQKNYFNTITETAFTDGAVYLLGRHYIAPGFVYEITPLIISRASALINTADDSVLASAGFEYNVAEDVYIDAGGYLGLGRGSDDLTRPNSEFGLYPDVYYSAINFYF